MIITQIRQTELSYDPKEVALSSQHRRICGIENSAQKGGLTAEFSITIKRKNLEIAGYLLCSVLLVFLLIIGVSITSGNAIGANVTNSTVLARVNVSNTEPILYSVKITHPLDFNSNIDLTANTATIVVCNGSYQDTNGFDDLKNVTATLYSTSVTSDSADDNNTHYTNSSCLPCEVVPGTNNQNGTCLCNFGVQYYADPATWRCNMTINDSGGVISSLNSTIYSLNEVLGISVENSIMDYGNLSVTVVSEFVRQNITNGGNIPLNITIRGYGSDNETIGQNVTMICEEGTNITFGYQRFYSGNDTAFADMLNLTNQTRQIPSLTIPQRTTDGGLGNSSNATFWKLQVPAGASGICNGTIIFGAIDATLT